ncbi:MAG TPA: MFS transporter [Herpetosiphonaceae bacterium]
MTQSASAQPSAAPQGLQTFIIVWFGQLVSLIGSGLTTFALGVWAYQLTGSVTLFAMITLAGTLPSILVSPFAGVYVDRWNRRKVLIASDFASAILTLLVAILLFSNVLAVWHIWGIVALRSVIRAFQLPAYTASVTMLIPKAHLARANGMMQFGSAAAQIVAPLLAGVLMQIIFLQGIILIDFVTFAIAVVTLLVVNIPQPASKGGQKKSVLREASYGWQYITERPGLFGMLIMFAIVNFAYGLAQVLFTPLVLKFSTAAWLGSIASAGGFGLLAGTLVLSSWGGPKPRIHGVLGFGILFGFSFFLAGIQPITWLIGVASFICMFCVPFINGCTQTIWQVKVPPEVQGRVFATRLMISWSTAPLAYVLAGPLSDGLFEPLLLEGGALAGSVGSIIGTGPGRGVGLLFVFIGMTVMLTSLSGYLYRPLRDVETLLPDAVPDKPAEAAAPAPAPAPAAEPAKSEGPTAEPAPSAG